MSHTSPLSEVSKKYLCCFYDILEDMIKGMTEPELTDSLSHNFIVQMIPHHEAAIKMSENILQYTTSIPLQRIARNIISEQTESIENMNRSVMYCSNVKNSSEDICLYNKQFQQITCKMFSLMRQAPATNNINADFIREMLPHHMGAIRMSENILRFQICTDLIPIIQAIITSQRRGICEMRSLLKCL